MNLPHVTESVGYTKTFKCSTCLLSFFAENTLLRHKCVKDEQNPNLYKCELCPQTYNHIKKLEIHLRTHKIRKKYKCSECNEIFTTKAALRQHRKTTLRFTCDVCEKVFYTKHHLRRHKSVHPSTTTFCCGICKAHFQTAFDYSEHLEDHKRQNVCEICSKECLDREALLRHLDNHKQGKKFECDKCSMGFSCVEDLGKHKRSAHETGRYLCDLCEEDFGTYERKKKHNREVHKIE